MSILERTVWIDKSIGIYVGELIEYDMREGGFSIIQKENLLPKEIIDEFKAMTKDERHKAVGNLAHSHGRKYKDIPKLLIDRFKDYRLQFGELNSLDDDDIFYIRKDAICTKKYCYHTKIDDFIEFREKKVYDCYMRIEPQYKEDGCNVKPNALEFYWSSSTGQIDVKGINDESVELHEKGMMQVISNFMGYLYSLNYDGALRYIVSVMDAYKRGFGMKHNSECPEAMYRRFDSTGKYRIWQDGAVLEVEEIGEELIPYCDKSYNYRNIFVPMMNLVIK